jgi:hypothetical protein
MGVEVGQLYRTPEDSMLFHRNRLIQVTEVSEYNTWVKYSYFDKEEKELVKERGYAKPFREFEKLERVNQREPEWE